MRTLAWLAICLFVFASARADQLIVNGGFETGDLTGWTSTSTGDGSFSVTSALVTPLTYNATIGPSSGTGPSPGRYYAVSDDYSSSQTQYLTQSFHTPGHLTSAVLIFQIFVNDVYGSDFGSSGRGAEVQLQYPTGQTLLQLYGPADIFEDPVGNPNPYVTIGWNLFPFLSSDMTYELRFSSWDTTGLINVGIDNVNLVVTNTPEPATLYLSATGGFLILCLAWKKRKAAET